MNTKKINKAVFLFLIMALLFTPALLHAVPKTKVLKPKNAEKKVTLLISGKKLAYYPVLLKEPSIVSVKGPGKLKVITRGYMNSIKAKKTNITVFYRINGGEKIKVAFKNLKADEDAGFDDESSGFPTAGENITIELSRGEHTIEFWSGSENPGICSRFLFTEIKEKKIDWVSLSPGYPNEPVSLITNEDVASYFRYSESKPLNIKITGPTVLRILNRFEFDYSMKGRINYRIRVREDKKIKNTYMLCSIRSELTGYKKDGKRIPGKANEIVISVPAGEHSYEIIPLDRNTLLAKILFPKKDIRLER